MLMDVTVLFLITLIALMALMSAFLTHYFYKRGKRAGINQMCSVQGWIKRDAMDLGFEAYMDLMSVEIAGIIPLAEAFNLDLPMGKKACKKVTVNTKVSGLIPSFHKHMILLNRKDPERFIAAFSTVAPLLISIKEGANKLTPANLPQIISGLGDLMANVGKLMKLLPEIQKMLPKGTEVKTGVKPDRETPGLIGGLADKIREQAGQK